MKIFTKNDGLMQSITVLLALLFIFSLAHANAVDEMTLSKKVKSSDLIVIGEIVSIQQKCSVAGNKCAKIHAMVTLKGRAVTDPSIIFDGMVGELDPMCCKVHKTYIFFLKNIKGNIYSSVNGPFGVYLIPEHTRK